MSASTQRIGIDVIVAVLVSTGWFADDLRLRSLAYRALAAFVVWPMLVSGLVCLGTGLLLCTLIVAVLQPGMDDVAAYGEELRTGDARTADDRLALEEQPQ
jgi:hypothetical protein